MSTSDAPRGRGTALNPPNRFERVWRDGSWRKEIMDAGDHFLDEETAPQTQIIFENAKTILAHNQSPDIGFDTSLNAYRGCEHGCVYCYARPTHEYLGYSSGLDFETKIVVKRNAPQLLRKELSSKNWKPRAVSMSGVTDCYQSLERRFQLTRKCIEVFLDFRNPVVIVTKNFLVTRDVDLLCELAKFNAVSVCISLTTLDKELARSMEPRASIPSRRLAAIKKLSSAGVPVAVLVCPVVPGLTDHEIPDILKAAAQAGAKFAGYNMIQLPYANRELFESWLEAHYPTRRDKVLSKIMQVRGGKLYDADFGQRMTGTGPIAEGIKTLFKIARRQSGISERGPRLSSTSFRRTPQQGSLFES
jgi:DNA repair photolyase